VSYAIGCSVYYRWGRFYRVNSRAHVTRRHSLCDIRRQ